IGPKLGFEPPAEEAREPTLRKGDKSADGWVEYLQQALNHHTDAGLDVDGDFGGQTLKAVKQFQRKFKKQGVLEDGIVGDQTWSYLRDGAPAKPKTDGRKPHSYVEKGAEARWDSEKDTVLYDYGGDNLLLMATSVGDEALVSSRKVRIKVVNPAGVQKVLARTVGEALQGSKGDHRMHMVVIAEFSTLFGETATPGQAAGGDYKITAYFPADLGGDTYDGTVSIMTPIAPIV
ncbi:MAG: peptidoglycan-binding domain-containing protein, partial [Caldimonas sp.]